MNALRKLSSLFCLLAALAPATIAAAAWFDVSFEAEVPAATRAHVQRALDTTADLLTTYKVILREPVQIIVTADLEGYTQARMFYLHESRPVAEQAAKISGGVSSNAKPLIIIKGTALLNREPQEAFRIIPHELFHQVQRQYGRTQTVTWLKEAAPESFQLIARETAGFGPVAEKLKQAELRVRKAATIPDACELATDNYAIWTGFMQRGLPVYEMSVLMVAQLSRDNGFENILFFYQLLHQGVSRDKAFVTAFRVPMSWFLSDMNAYFSKLRLAP